MSRLPLGEAESDMLSMHLKYYRDRWSLQQNRHWWRAWMRSVAQNSILKKWRTFLRRWSHKSSVTSRRWPLCFLPGDATVNRHFETGSDDAGRLPGLFLITGATHVLPSAIKATPSIFHHVLASEDRSGGELRTCWRAAQASERGVFWRTSSATTKGAETFGGSPCIEERELPRPCCVTGKWLRTATMSSGLWGALVQRVVGRRLRGQSSRSIVGPWRPLHLPAVISPAPPYHKHTGGAFRRQ